MLVIHSRIEPQNTVDAELELTFEARSKTRLRCFSTSGEEVGLFLERGQRRWPMANACKPRTAA